MSIKHPKTATNKSSSHRSMTDTEEKMEPKSPLGDALKKIRFTKSGYDSSGEPDKAEEEPYLMRIVDENGKELAQLKSIHLHPLKNLSNQIVSISNHLVDVM